jgi:thiol-disulfide isomerase/thioredoxin
MEKFLKSKIPAALLYTLMLALLLSGCTQSEPPVNTSIETTEAAMGNIGVFSTQDLNGEAIDNSIFAEQKLTMINIWATFCRPCIEELPDLQKMSQDMPKGTQLISIVGDAVDEEHLKLARQIARDTGVSFTSLVPDKSLQQYLDDNLTAYPTTIFVDSNGKMVGEPIIGRQDMSIYKKVLNDRLAQVGS